jgi:cytochrome c-type biogenesis protein CcmH
LSGIDGLTARTEPSGQPGSRGRRAWPEISRALSSWIGFGLLALVVLVALVIGSNHPPRSSAASRISYLDSVIKCPSCDDLTLAESNASTAVTLRAIVARQVRAGKDNAAIEAYAVSRYGEGILLLPKTSGADLALYLIPGVAALAAVGGIGLFAYRHRTAEATAGPDEKGGVGQRGAGQPSEADEALVAAARESLR